MVVRLKKTSKKQLDIEALYVALDGKRRQCGLSWRRLAYQLAISPSTFTRLMRGKRPDVDTFLTILSWLEMTADIFMKG